MMIIGELGDLRRFESPRSLVHFLGLAPGEHSTGASRRQGANKRQERGGRLRTLGQPLATL
jgi:transposase